MSSARIVNLPFKIGLFLAILAIKSSMAEEVPPPEPPRPTVYPAVDFNVTADAIRYVELIKESTESNIPHIIHLLSHRSVEQRTAIIYKINEMYGNIMLFVCLKPFAYDGFVDASAKMFSPLPTLYAYTLRNAIQDRDDDTIIEILLSLNKTTITPTLNKYTSIYEGMLMTNIDALDSPSEFKNITQYLINASYDKRNDAVSYNTTKAIENARILAHLLDSNEEVNYHTLNHILLDSSYLELQYLYVEFYKIAKIELEEAINKKFEFPTRQYYNHIVNYNLHIYGYFATLLYDAMSLKPIDSRTISRVIIGRSEIDLGNIKSAFSRIYNKKLEDYVREVTSGDYQTLLLAFIEP